MKAEAHSCPGPPERHLIQVVATVRTVPVPSRSKCYATAGRMTVDRPMLGKLRIRLKEDTRVFIQLGDLWLTGSVYDLRAGRRMQIDYFPLPDRARVQRGIATEIYMLEH